ncbi:MAG: hypothetical protein Q4C77_16230 [Eubacteriales bacterium]|nr:hypothetical protein [Eubacteriales bacterium]
MAYIEKEDSREVVLIGYYNVLFYLLFRIGLDEYKKDILISRINRGEKMMMKDIYEWCQKQEIEFKVKFIYRKDFSLMANIWNLYSFCRLKLTVRELEII